MWAYESLSQVSTIQSGWSGAKGLALSDRDAASSVFRERVAQAEGGVEVWKGIRQISHEIAVSRYECRGNFQAIFFILTYI